MTGTLKAGVARDVHVQQVARARPLVAVDGLPWRALGPREARQLEHLPDRRVSEAGDGSDQPWPPARLPAAGADPLLQLGGELARTVVRATRTIAEAAACPPLRRAARAQAMRPAMGRRRRHAE